LSFELKEILNVVANENNKQEKLEFEQGMDRYESLLLKVKAERKLDVLTSVEGVEYKDKNRQANDLKVLEKAHLVTGEAKYTHRNAYRQYRLTERGADLAEKLVKEKTATSKTSLI
jgi:hypothetical protein